MIVRRDTDDIAVEDGRIVVIAPELPASGEEIDARGLAVLSGLIDVHVHFNEPGRTEWEGAATGSRALAAGGGTLFFDAAELVAVYCRPGGVRCETRGARTRVGHRFRVVGRDRRPCNQRFPCCWSARLLGALPS